MADARLARIAQEALRGGASEDDKDEDRDDSGGADRADFRAPARAVDTRAPRPRRTCAPARLQAIAAAALLGGADAASDGSADADPTSPGPRPPPGDPLPPVPGGAAAAARPDAGSRAAAASSGHRALLPAAAPAPRAPPPPARPRGGGRGAAAAGAVAGPAHPDADDAVVASDTGASGNAPSSSEGSESDASSGGNSLFSTECLQCHRHIARGDGGFVCEIRGCRATRCPECAGPAAADTEWWCRQHAPTAQPIAAVAASGVEGAPAAPTLVLVRALPTTLQDAARAGLERAAADLPAGWRADPDLGELLADVQDTLEWGASATRAKGRSAVRRLAEYLAVAPRALLDAVATARSVDILLAGFTSARCGTARRQAIPEGWRRDDLNAPQWRRSVGSEVAAIIGLLRLAKVLPADPRGTIPITRRVLRKCKCLSKLEASPRAYTFAWELRAAFACGSACRDARTFAVFSLLVTCLYFLLRPRYGKGARRRNLYPARTDGPQHYRFKWSSGDKTNQPGAPAAAAHAAGAARAAAGATAAGAAGAASSAVAAAGGATDTAAAAAPGRASRSASRGPVTTTRLTCAAGDLLHVVLTEWAAVRQPERDDGLMFCRTEVARSVSKAPVGARLSSWRGVPVWLWPRTPLSPGVVRTAMRGILAPIVPPRALQFRILAGLRGGGEMELVEQGASTRVRATLGWWRARRLTAEGAMITYEGTSSDSMYAATGKLGSTYIRVLAPGVYCTRPTPFPARSSRGRIAAARVARAWEPAPVRPWRRPSASPAERDPE